MYNLKEISKRVRHLLGEPMVSVEIQEETMQSLLILSINQWKLLSEFSNIEKIKLSKIERMWVESYFQALCKEQLGRVYGKYENLSIPGSELKLNYQELLSDSEKEKNKLEDLLIPVSKKNLVAVYINTGNLEQEEVNKMMKKLSKDISIKGFQFIFIPTRNQETKIECVYPIASLNEENQNLINSKIEQLLKDNKNESK